MEILVRFRPGDVEPNEVVGATVVIVDILRATSTITVAIDRGAEVVTVPTVDEARAALRRYPSVLLAGERRGIRPEGFDFGNSPRQLLRHELSGKTLVMTTTNGTAAIQRFSGASQLFAGALVNATAVARVLIEAAPPRVWMICSGVGGGMRYSLEDTLGCGAIASRIGDHLGTQVRLDDAARIAVASYQAEADMLDSTSARYLASIGAADDVEFCTRQDTTAAVAQLHGDRFRAYA